MSEFVVGLSRAPCWLVREDEWFDFPSIPGSCKVNVLCQKGSPVLAGQVGGGCYNSLSFKLQILVPGHREGRLGISLDRSDLHKYSANASFLSEPILNS